MIDEINITTSNYFVTHHHADPERLIVSFASRGFAGGGEPIEEFALTLRRQGVSAIFVTDRHAQWWNHTETHSVFIRIAEVCKQYRYVGLIGESMGASGAISFTPFFPGVNRVLAFCPQFSIASPFIEFDARFRDMKKIIPLFQFLSHDQSISKSRIEILYGNLEWEDYIHSCMYMAADFSVTTIDGAPHDVARHLKHGVGSNLLNSLITEFCSFDNNFDKHLIKKILGELYVDNHLKRWHNALFSETSERQKHLPVLAPAPEGLINLSQGRPADQSSISIYSHGSTTAEDAQGAVNNILTGSYSFHTDEEEGAWWSVDLGSVREIREIRIYNRSDSDMTARRFRCFKIELKIPDTGIYETYHNEISDSAPNYLGYPFVWIPVMKIYASSVRISLTRKDFLHLDEVQVYGL